MLALINKPDLTGKELEELWTIDATHPFIEERSFIQQQLADLKNAKASKKQINLLKDHLTGIHRILAALHAGFVITSPPNWHCGVFDTDPRYMEEKSETFAGQSRFNRVAAFKGVVPARVLPRWEVAKKIFGKESIRIYSPDPKDFEVPRPIIDPMMFGRITHNGNPLYFRIAEWDLGKDYAKWQQAKGQLLLESGSQTAE